VKFKLKTIFLMTTTFYPLVPVREPTDGIHFVLYRKFAEAEDYLTRALQKAEEQFGLAY
jgi:hypothetical protein